MKLGYLNPRRYWEALDEEAKRDARIAALLVLFGIVMYVPGIWWGLPAGTDASLIRGWGPDELGPNGPLAEVSNLFLHTETGNPQYPMFHYFVCLALCVPYLAILFLTGGIHHPQGTYPFGFVNPPAVLQTLLILSRLASVLAGAGTGAVAYFTAKRLWNRTEGVVAGLIVLLTYTMFYYARVSTVDVGALFWASLGLYLFVGILKDGLSVKRAAWIGLIAAVAVATKDLNYGVFLLLPLAMLPLHYARQSEAGITDVWARMKAPLTGLLVCVIGYLVASGFVFYPQKYFKHLAFLRAGGTHYRYFFEYPVSLAGYWGLAKQCFDYVVDSLNWPLVMVGVLGIIVAARKDRKLLALLLPVVATYFAVLLPVRHTELRYQMSAAYILALFAAAAFAEGFGSPNKALRALTGILLAVGLGWSALRAGDLTYLMLHDSRYAAGAWFEQNVKGPVTVEYFGDFSYRSPLRVVFLPRLPNGSHWAIANVGIPPGSGAPAAPFIILQGTPDFAKHWNCPPWALQKLEDGSFGYRRVAVFETKTLFSHHSLSMNPDLNPRVEIFERTSAAQIEKQPRENNLPAKQADKN